MEENTPNPAPSEAAESKRAFLERMLHEVSPDVDFSDDDTLFSRIIDDYAQYAALIEEFDAKVKEAEIRGRNARIDELMAQTEKPPLSDGLPNLGGNEVYAPRHPETLFDLARGA